MTRWCEGAEGAVDADAPVWVALRGALGGVLKSKVPEQCLQGMGKQVGLDNEICKYGVGMCKVRAVCQISLLFDVSFGSFPTRSASCR